MTKRIQLHSVSEFIDYGLTASATDTNTGVKFLRITDIQDDVVDWEIVPYCHCSKEEAKQYELRAGDILFTRTGATTGKSYLIRQFPHGAVFASYLIRVRPNTNVIDSSYLSYFFRTPDYWHQVMGSAVGAAQIGVNSTKLGGLLIPLPPLPEQQRIAAILDKADRLRRLRRYALDLGETYLQSVFLEMFGDQRQFPLMELGDLLSDDPKNGLYLPAEKYGQGTPIIRITEFYDGELGNPDDFKRVEANQQEIDEFNVQNGEILINRVNSLEYLGKCALVEGLREPTLFESNMMRIRVDASKALSIFLTKFLSSQQAYVQIMRCAKKAVNQASINQTDVKSFVVPVPPLALQEKFAGIVRQYDRLRAQQRESLRQAEMLFGAVLERAFR